MGIFLTEIWVELCHSVKFYIRHKPKHKRPWGSQGLFIYIFGSTTNLME